ncbi:MAG: prolipoprotein diacylglyceryl transferase [Lachnospiraceae bacterium]|nr:prolipoprotein diacylglyceryl transferase [Lachnospiraceae bacterium]
MSVDSILFQNLHIAFKNVGQSIQLFGIDIAYYGMIIAFGMVLAGAFILSDAKRKGQDEDAYMDVILWAIIIGVIGARVYYVVFSWDEYKDNWIDVFKFREGGLAIYGGIIGGLIGTLIVCHIKKLKFLDVADSACLGVLIGQVFGRWGNFFNREAFGGYSDGLFSMQIPIEAVRDSTDITTEMMQHLVTIDGISFISVHPTFLYESLWNVGVFLFLFFLRKKKSFDGEIWFFYLALYGLGRMWIEGLRTDQLKFSGTNVAVSQVLSAVLVILSLIYLVYHFIKLKDKIFIKVRKEREH